MNASGIWKGMVKGCDRIGTFKFGKVQPLMNENNGIEKSKQNAKHRPKSLLQLLRTIGMEVSTTFIIFCPSIYTFGFGVLLIDIIILKILNYIYQPISISIIYTYL